jgi:hypothetical protein
MFVSSFLSVCVNYVYIYVCVSSELQITKWHLNRRGFDHCKNPAPNCFAFYSFSEKTTGYDVTFFMSYTAMVPPVVNSR